MDGYLAPFFPGDVCCTCGAPLLAVRYRRHAPGGGNAAEVCGAEPCRLLQPQAPDDFIVDHLTEHGLQATRFFAGGTKGKFIEFHKLLETSRMLSLSDADTNAALFGLLVARYLGTNAVFAHTQQPITNRFGQAYATGWALDVRDTDGPLLRGRGATREELWATLQLPLDSVQRPIWVPLTRALRVAAQDAAARDLAEVR